MAADQRRRVCTGTARFASGGSISRRSLVSAGDFGGFRARAGSALRRRSSDRLLPGVESTFLRTLAADALANVIRNVWSHAIIFCGHFPDQTYTFSEDEVEDETRGGVVSAPDGRSGQYRGRPAVPCDQRQPGLSSRAPPISGYAKQPILGDRAEDQGHLRALRAAVQHRAILEAMVHGAPHHLSIGLPWRAAPAEARAVPQRGAAHRARDASEASRSRSESRPSTRPRAQSTMSGGVEVQPPARGND